MTDVCYICALSRKLIRHDISLHARLCGSFWCWSTAARKTMKKRRSKTFSDSRTAHPCPKARCLHQQTRRRKPQRRKQGRRTAKKEGQEEQKEQAAQSKEGVVVLSMQCCHINKILITRNLKEPEAEENEDGQKVSKTLAAKAKRVSPSC